MSPTNDSATPRTDLEAFDADVFHGSGYGDGDTVPQSVVTADFARQLERELAAANNRADGAELLAKVTQQHYESACSQRDALAAQLADARGYVERARPAVGYILEILTEKDDAGIDIEIGSTALKSLIRWAREATAALSAPPANAEGAKFNPHEETDEMGRKHDWKL